MNYNKALKLANEVIRLLPYKKYIAGSLRRKESIIEDIDIILLVPELDVIIHNAKLKLISGKNRKLNFKYKNVSIDVFISLKHELPFMKFQYYNTKEDNIKYRAMLKHHGYKLNQYGLYDNDKYIKNINTVTELKQYIKKIKLN